MKLLLSCILALSGFSVFGQGTVQFANGGGTAVTNALTHARAAADGSFVVTLYFGSDGTTNEALLYEVARTPFSSPGLFNGGFIQMPVGGTNVMLQVRVFEAAYGSNYEQAYSAPAMNGRRALTGKSNLMRKYVYPNVADPPVSLTASSGGQTPLRPFPLDALLPDLPQLTINDVLVFEGDSGTTGAVFTVTLIGASNTTVSVDFHTSDGSADGNDYNAASGTLVFNPGESNKTVTVTVRGDTESENDETFFVNLTNAVNGVVVRSSGRGTIYNDDCRTSLAVASYTGVTINGCVGKPYRIEASDLSNTNTWLTVTNFVLPSSPYVWIDFASPGTQQRFYRAVLLAP